MDAVQSGHADFGNLPFSPPLAYWNSRSPHVAIGHMWNNTPVRPCLDLEGHCRSLPRCLSSPKEADFSFGSRRRSSAQRSSLQKRVDVG